MIPRDPIDYEAIQRRVLLRVQRRYRFFFHTAIFLLGLPVLGNWGSAEIFIAWLGLWIFHLIWLQYHNHIEKAIEQEIQSEREKVYKRKREEAHLHRLYQNGRKNHEEDFLDEDSEYLDYNYEEDYR